MADYLEAPDSVPGGGGIGSRPSCRIVNEFLAAEHFAGKPVHARRPRGESSVRKTRLMPLTGVAGKIVRNMAESLVHGDVDARAAGQGARREPPNINQHQAANYMPKVSFTHHRLGDSAQSIVRVPSDGRAYESPGRQALRAAAASR